jgi:uncharacterized membrane protein YfcA
LIVKFGIVPVGFGLMIAIWVAIWLHRNLLQIGDRQVRSMAAACMGIVVGMIGSSLLSGSLLTVFPNNVFFWVLVACVLVGLQSRDVTEEKAGAKVSPQRTAAMSAFARFGGEHHSEPLQESVR